MLCEAGGKRATRDGPLCRPSCHAWPDHVGPATTAQSCARVPRPSLCGRSTGVPPRTSGSPCWLLWADISPGRARVDPTAIGLLTIGGGALAIVGNVVAEWGSNRWAAGGWPWSVASGRSGGPWPPRASAGRSSSSPGSGGSSWPWGRMSPSARLGSNYFRPPRARRPQGCVWSS